MIDEHWNLEMKLWEHERFGMYLRAFSLFFLLFCFSWMILIVNIDPIAQDSLRPWACSLHHPSLPPPRQPPPLRTLRFHKKGGANKSPTVRVGLLTS